MVRENKPFQMGCYHTFENITRVRWEFVSTDNKINEVIYDSLSNKTMKSGFEISCQSHGTFIPNCILKLVQARKEDSGKYICYVGKENEAMFDSILFKNITEVELIVRGRQPNG